MSVHSHHVYQYTRKIHIFLKQTICFSVRWYLSPGKIAHVTCTENPPATVILREDVKIFIRSLFSETFILARAEARCSLTRTSNVFCYSTANSKLNQTKLYNFYENWMYYITLIIILTICSLVACRFSSYLLFL